MYTKRQILQLEKAGALITSSELSVEQLTTIKELLTDDLLPLFELMIAKARIQVEIDRLLKSFEDNLST